MNCAKIGPGDLITLIPLLITVWMIPLILKQLARRYLIGFKLGDEASEFKVKLLLCSRLYFSFDTSDSSTKTRNTEMVIKVKIKFAIELTLQI
jgi:hypothetical protein